MNREKFLSSLNDEFRNDPEQLGYLPLMGEREVFKQQGEANPQGVHTKPAVPAREWAKLVGNDVFNANLVNDPRFDGRSRANILWGDTVTVTAQDFADIASRP